MSSQLDSKSLKIQMISLTVLVYAINALIIVMMRGFEDFTALFKNVDFIAIFQLGLVFGLACVAGYLYVPGLKLKQVFTFGYMLPLTGTSMISIAAIYFSQLNMNAATGLWVLMALLLVLLAFSFGSCYRVYEFNRHQAKAV